MFNYQKICLDLLKDLPQKQKEIILRRFALSTLASGEDGIKRATLESIGRDFGITRERVRQIEEDGLEKVKQKNNKYQKIFQCSDNTGQACVSSGPRPHFVPQENVSLP